MTVRQALRNPDWLYVTPGREAIGIRKPDSPEAAGMIISYIAGNMNTELDEYFDPVIDKDDGWRFTYAPWDKYLFRPISKEQYDALIRDHLASILI